MSGNRSQNKFCPKQDDLQGQILQLGLLTQSDLNIMGQIINLINYSNDNLKRYSDYMEREKIKRIYFKQVFTHELKKFVDSFPKELSSEELAQYDDEPELKQKAIEEHKRRYEDLHNSYNLLNKELKAKGLPLIE